MTIGFLLLISVIITVILYYIISYRPAKRRAERAARRRAYLQRRTELIKERDEMEMLYFYVNYYKFLKNSQYGIYIKED